MLFVEYPTCTTCKRAKKYLESHNIEFTDRNIKEENPTVEELGLWQPKSGKEIKKFFNTSGQVYRSENIKERLPEMSDEEKLALLATNGMLVKRPILVLADTVLVGFKEAEWEEALRRNGYLK
ncbi:arsenate reductase family protein [Veillonella criceti]|uniref:Regulatory protein spx n=1 Tax=Veillonella criceti TaxID=103891 RepID=A0A380NH52_9FIRM|nr:arsenate reductase family protein [Veillonella criceti]SUP40346.1 Regulatory protein spx [Veillonella criceti]